MAGTPVLERLTASDLFLLMWDDYGWSSDIGGLAICDGTGLLDSDGRIRIGAVRTLLEPRLELFPMMPVMGNLTLVVAVLSYAGQLNLTAVADHDHCPDLEIFTRGVHTALDDLARTVPAPAPR